MIFHSCKKQLAAGNKYDNFAMEFETVFQFFFFDSSLN